jgi:hypothetical protein
MSRNWQPVFVRLLPMEPAAQPLPNRALDALGQQWDEYKRAVAHRDMHHGQRGMTMAQRAEHIEALVRGLAALAPPRAQHVAIDPAHGNIDGLLKDIRSAREAVVPPRRQHDPKHRYAINHESDQAIAFLREFADQWDGPDAAYTHQHFPNLRHAAHTAAHMVAVYDLSVELQQEYHRGHYSGPLTPVVRSRAFDAIKAKTNALSDALPPLVPIDEAAQRYLPPDQFGRYNECLQSLHFTLNTLPAAMMPNRTDPVADIQKGVNELRYEACAAAHRAFRQISLAYKADRKLIHQDAKLQGALDPIRQALPMLDRVYHARWALLADAIGDTVKSNRKLLENQGKLKPQTRAEAEQERREQGGEAQGRLF